MRAPGHTAAASPPLTQERPRHCLSAPHTVQPQGSVPSGGPASQGRWLPPHSPAKNSPWDGRASPRKRGKHPHLVWGKAMICGHEGGALLRGLALCCLVMLRSRKTLKQVSHLTLPGLSGESLA